jgi:RimJ/RimL family protein N-acetyltransferase
MSLELRRATAADEARLLAWRNDPETRAQAFTSHVVKPDEHRRWLRARLDDPNMLLTIAEHDGGPAGTVRLDRHGPAIVELSLTIAPEYRGRGLAKEAIRLGVGQARDRLHAATVIARIKATNTASVGAFAAAGFTRRREGQGVIEMSCRVPRRVSR